MKSRITQEMRLAVDRQRSKHRRKGLRKRFRSNPDTTLKVFKEVEKVMASFDKSRFWRM